MLTTLDEPGPQGRIFAIRLSKRTMRDGTKLSLHDYAINQMGVLFKDSKAVLLSDLLNLTNPDLNNVPMGASSNIDFPFLTELISIILTIGANPPLRSKRIIDDFRRAHTRPVDLFMSEKYYPARGDYRAYYQDKNFARMLCGAIIDKLLLGRKGRSIKLRAGIPLKGKNLIDLRITTLPGESGFVAIGDISNFTGSNPNTWLLIITMIQQLRYLGGQSNLMSPFIVTIGGYPLEVNLLEVLNIYLYTTVLAPASYKDTEFYAMGGYLGVMGNIQLTSLFFFLVLDALNDHLPEGIKLRMSNKIGGDDWCNAGVYPNSLLREDHLKRLIMIISRYVGHLKEVNILRIEELPMGVHNSGVEFCKRILITDKTIDRHGRTHVHIYSEPTLPLMSILLKENIPLTQKTWVEFTASLQGCCRQMHQGHVYFNFFCQLFYKLNPKLTPGYYLRSDPPNWDGELVSVDGFNLSLKADKLVRGEGCILDSLGVAYRYSYRSILQYLQSRDKICQVRVRYFTNPDIVIFLTHKERKSLVLMKTFIFTPLDAVDTDLLGKAITLIKTFRAIL